MAKKNALPSAQAAIDKAIAETVKPAPEAVKAAIDKAIAETVKPAPEAVKPAPDTPRFAPDLAQALQTIAQVCDSAPVSGPMHRTWQQALDRIANALPKV